MSPWLRILALTHPLLWGSLSLVSRTSGPTFESARSDARPSLQHSLDENGPEGALGARRATGTYSYPPQEFRVRRALRAGRILPANSPLVPWQLPRLNYSYPQSLPRCRLAWRSPR